VCVEVSVAGSGQEDLINNYWAKPFKVTIHAWIFLQGYHNDCFGLQDVVKGQEV